MNYPRGLAATDPIFTRTITYNMNYSAVSWHQRTWAGGSPACLTAPGAFIPGAPVYDYDDVAERIALEAIWRGYTRSEFETTPNDDVAICIVRFCDPVRQQLSPVSGSMPNLYGHGSDWIEVERSRLTGTPSYYFRTVWMTNGIDESRTWMQNFVDSYQDFVETCSSTDYRAAIPSRFVFDQEPPPILMGSPVGGTHASFPLLSYPDGFVSLQTIDPSGSDPEYPSVITWDDMLDYWEAVKADPRFGTGTESGVGAGTSSGGVPVPGCGGKTLWRLWWEARNLGGISNPGAMPSGSAQYFYWGGTEANQKWYAWFSSINHQANIGAMDEAAYQVISAKWPGCMSSDYDNSMKTSAYLLRGDIGAYGPTGLSYPVETQFGYNRASPGSSTFTTTPMDAGVLNALHFYSDVGSLHWLKFREDSAWYGNVPSMYPSEIERWGNTGGVNEYTYGLLGDGRQSPMLGSDPYANNGDEFWEATSLRVNNFELANCFRANLPNGDYDAAEGMAAWITLPNQPIEYFDIAPTGEYNDHTYANFRHLPMRQSTYSLYRTVADCRMHGVNEFMVWNDTGQDADDDWDGTSPTGPWGGYEGFYLHGGLHADRESNWNLLRQVIHQVYAYDPTVEAIRGSYATGMAYSSGSPYFTERLRYADHQDADSTAVRAVMVDPAGSASNQTARIQLKFTPNGTIDTTGDCINFEVRLKTSITASVKVEVLQDGLYWVRLGSNAPDMTASDMDGKHFYLWDIPTGTDFRTIRFRLPRTTVDSHTLIDDTTSEVNIRVTANLAGVASPSLTIDNAICYVSVQQNGHPADLNADGVVDSKDDDTFTLLSTYSGSASTAPLYRNYIDYDRDGVVLSDTNDATTWGTISALDSTWSLDAHRYSMVDLDMMTSTGVIGATCPADVGQSGGVPGTDGVLDNNDIIVFITWYFNSDSNADIGGAGGTPGPDSLFNANDFIVFVNEFFTGCTP